MEFEISFERSRIQKDTVYRFISSSYWLRNIKEDVFEESLKHSLILGAYRNDTHEQIGFARVVTDYAVFAWICDVFVDESYRGQGIGKALMKAIFEHPSLQTIRRFSLSTKDAHTLYEQFGFQEVPPHLYMFKTMPTERWQKSPEETTSPP